MDHKYISFMEKITRKLADAFLQINQLCVQQLMNVQSKTNGIEKLDQIIPPPELQLGIQQEVQNNQDSIDQEENQKQIKQLKTKKIKKDNQIEEQKELQQNKNKKKIKKLSHKPKAPASSFLIFFKEQQSNIARMYPTYGVTQLTKVAAKCWNELAAQQKDPYIKLGDQQRKIYQERMQKYRLQFPHQIAEKQKIRKEIKKQKEKEKKTNKESQTPKKQRQKQQIQQKIPLENPQVKPSYRKQPQDPEHIVIQSKQSESNEDLEQEDDSLGMV